MNHLDVAVALNAEGRFIEAMAALERSHPDPNSRGARLVLRAELLERAGRFGQSRATIAQLNKSMGITAKEESSCEFVLGKIDSEEGATESALTHLQRAVSLASDAGDLRRKCWPNMSLLLAVSDSTGPEAAAPILWNFARTP
jgi:tetratricopeptide (TPR) repeat protein